ncbi:hypothetical protein ACLI4Z_01895 [Natrialbaceae archaeon A-arb3/5]
MIGALIVMSLFALLIPLVLWALVLDETSNPTVVDRSEAERIAKTRGWRGADSDDSENEDHSRSEHRPHTGGETHNEGPDRNDGSNDR